MMSLLSASAIKGHFIIQWQAETSAKPLSDNMKLFPILTFSLLILCECYWSSILPGFDWFSSFSGTDSFSQNITSKSLYVVSSDNVILRTKLYKGFLGSGNLLAKFAHGLDDGKIWSINVLIQDRASSLVPVSYPTTIHEHLSYSFYSNGGFIHIVTASTPLLAGAPYRVAITYQEWTDLLSPSWLPRLERCSSEMK